jgi:putative endonuclease
MNYKKKLGLTGEKTVEQKYLKNKYKKLDSNFITKTGEIDLIFYKKETIVFVEVKTRKDWETINPVLNVDLRKRKKIIKTAKIFLLKKNVDSKDYKIRFDIAVVYVKKDDCKIKIYENAFDEKGNVI